MATVEPGQKPCPRTATTVPRSGEGPCGVRPLPRGWVPDWSVMLVMLGPTRDTGKLAEESDTVPSLAVTVTWPAGPARSFWLVNVSVLCV